MRWLNDVVKAGECAAALIAGAQPDPDRHAAAGRHRPQVKPGGLGAVAGGVHRLGAAVDDVVVERILEVAGRWAAPEQPREIGLVVAEQQAIRCFEFDAVGAELLVLRQHQSGAPILQRRFRNAGSPAPDVSEPDLRQDMNGRRVRPAVVDGDPHEHIVGIGLGIFDVDVEVPVVIEDAGIDQFELHRRRALATCVLLEQPFVGICALAAACRAGARRRSSGRHRDSSRSP